MSVYFWSVPVTAWKHKNTSSPPNTSLSLFLCQSVFLYHFVINIFKLIAGSHTHIQYILFPFCVLLYFWRHTPPHISVRRPFILHVCRAVIGQIADTRASDVPSHFLYSSGCLRRLTSCVLRGQGPLLTPGRRPETQRRRTREAGKPSHALLINMRSIVGNTRVHTQPLLELLVRETDCNNKWYLQLQHAEGLTSS